MFQGCDFIYAGIPSSHYGLYIVDIDNKSNDDAGISTGTIVETRIPNRLSPLHYGVQYNEDPLTFTLVFGSDNELDRFDIQRVSMWLTGYQQYQWLMVDQPDLSHLQYRCLITELEPITYGWIPYAFQAKVTCDCQYAYSFPWTKSYTVNTIESSEVFVNESTCRERLTPDFEIEIGSGCTEVKIKNTATGKEMKFSSLPSGTYKLMIDGKNMVVTDSLNNLTNPYAYFNFEFLTLVSGLNELKLSKVGSGAVTVKMKGRFLFSVGA